MRKKIRISSGAPTLELKPGGVATPLRKGVTYDVQAAVPYLFNRTTAGMHDSLRPRANRRPPALG